MNRGGIAKTYTTHVAKCSAELLYKQTHTIHDGFVRVQTKTIWDEFMGLLWGNVYPGE